MSSWCCGLDCRGGHACDWVLQLLIQESSGCSEHNQLDINTNSDKTKVNECRRDLGNATVRKLGKRSPHVIDWNDKMKTRQKQNVGTFKKSEPDSVIILLKKQGKQSKKTHLSKENFMKIMLQIYKHIGKDIDYKACKEALNASTNEVRKSKRNVEFKVAHNMKSYSTSFHAYVSSKQNVRDKLGLLADKI